MPQSPRRGRSASRLSRARAGRVGPPRLGSARRAQVITTYGVGAMIAVDSESYIVRGLESWSVPSDFGLTEPRLQHQLGVDGFHLPPAGPDDKAAEDGVRVARFPEWYSCSTCHRLDRHRRLTADKNKCGKCQTTELTPSRFVMVCENGHLDDFPYWAWVHKRSAPSGGSDRHELTLRSTGRTASLRSIQISCSCGITRSLEGALSRKELAGLGIRCVGRRPWLKDDEKKEECSAEPRAIQRGSSTAWFPQVASALTIPPWSQGASRVVRRYMAGLQGKSDASILAFLNVLPRADRRGYAPEDLLAAVRIAERARESAESVDEEEAVAVAGDPLRRDEYQQLQRVTPEETDAEFETEEPGPLGDLSKCGIEQVMLVPRLREVRALTSFTRLVAPSPANVDRRSPLSRNPQGWLPAIEVVGEGVFLRLDADRLAQWREGRPAVRRRAERVRRHHSDLLAEEARETRDVPDSPVTPELLLVHSLAHALINEWSLDCGYPAASLRERLYVDPDMAGVLIYTATSDSAGSLGGLVSQGDPARLSDSLRSALDRASWCSADPLCIESTVSGADNLNLAACHCCLLLPETSCENYNRFLDRGMLTGLPDDSGVGFFDGAF